MQLRLRNKYLRECMRAVKQSILQPPKSSTVSREAMHEAELTKKSLQSKQLSVGQSSESAVPIERTGFHL